MTIGWIETTLSGVAEAAGRHPDTSIFCGRILPDWDGSEPQWVHDTGAYRIFPLPVPRYDAGDQSREITDNGPVPGGGNLCVRREVFDRVGGFSTELGPHGHDLGGGEDIDFVLRCLAAGERIQYVPSVRQYHYVDPERLRLGYLLRKSFQRSRSGIRSEPQRASSVPLYMWRKLATYFVLGVVSLSWPRTRFYLVRLAAALGELRGFLDNARGPRPAGGRRRHPVSVRRNSHAGSRSRCSRPHLPLSARPATQRDRWKPSSGSHSSALWASF